MVATTHRSPISGLSHSTASRGADRHSSNAEGIEITLNAIPDCAIDWLKDNVFWNQFGRKEQDGYGKLLRLRKSESSISSWNVVLGWLRSPECLNGVDEGVMNCEITRANLKLFTQIHDKEIIFLLRDCVPKIKKR